MATFLLGMIAMGCAVVALLFLRFWRTTHDRFFLWFSSAFFIEACNRVGFVVRGAHADEDPTYFIVRIVFFVLIIIAIVDKNLASRAALRRQAKPSRPESAPGR